MRRNVELELGPFDPATSSRPVVLASVTTKEPPPTRHAMITAEHPRELEPGHVRPTGVRLLWSSSTAYLVGGKRVDRAAFLNAARAAMGAS